MRLPLLVLLAMPAVARADAPPTWPPGAALEISTQQLLYDQPAKTEDELARRFGRFGVHLRWPAGSDDQGVTGYRVKRDGRTVAELGREVLTFEEHVRGRPVYAVEALDGAGNASPPLEGRAEHDARAPAATRAVASPPAAPAIPLDDAITALRVEGPLAVAEAERALRGRRDRTRACGKAELGRTGAERASVVVRLDLRWDGTPEAIDAVEGSTEARACVVAALEDLRLRRADAASRISFRLEWSKRADAAPAPVGLAGMIGGEGPSFSGDLGAGVSPGGGPGTGRHPLTLQAVGVEVQGGLAPGHVGQVLAPPSGSVRHCLIPDAANPVAQRGELGVRLEVAPDGQVTRSEVTAEDAGQRDCVDSGLRRLRFAASAQPSVVWARLAWSYEPSGDP